MSDEKPLKVVQCESCGADMVFLKTINDKWIPVDADTVTEGDTLFDPDEHVTHFLTCPDAKEHRR